jgi:hypothetical protein
MTATGHALIGTVIAAKVSNPALAIPIALASHVIADALPHWDTGTNRKRKTKTAFLVQTIIDVLLGLCLSLFLLAYLFPKTNLYYALFIIFVAQSFDWATAPYVFFDMKFAPFSWVYKFQKLFDNRLAAPWGVIDQVFLVLLAIIAARFI